MATLQPPKGILSMNAFEPDAGISAANPGLQRRLEHMGSATVLFYQQPIEMVSAAGAWMTDSTGKRYLDCYNNVPCIGHSHPAVTEAVSQQLGRLNTHTRYLVRIVDDYLEALLSHFPSQLNRALLTCSGSEANDLAMRLAMKATASKGFIVTEAAYHGNTALVTEASPSSFKRGSVPDHVQVVPAPSRANYGDNIEAGFAADIQQAINTLTLGGHGIATLLVDSVFSSDGVHTRPCGFLREAVDKVHAAGGLYIADEVQPGFGRLGSHFWGFEYHGLMPDIVTMGKPMGNGFPMAGLVCRDKLLADYCEDQGYFNTFGGNPVACAAGLAVLKVLQQQALPDNAQRQGDYLLREIRHIASDSALLGDVRGQGLFLGIDIINPESGLPDASTTSQVIELLKHEGVLAGASGIAGATLKLRPSLCIQQHEADWFLAALRSATCNRP